MFSGNENPVPCIFLSEVFIENKLTRRSLLSALSLFPAARLLSGQQSPAAGQTPNYSTDVKLVNLFATVRDKSGKIVKDLTKDDFSLDEEDRPQTIKFFEQESSLPLNLGMMVDTSGSQARVLGEERSAGIKFFDQILRQDRDLAFVIHFDFEVELLQDFTAIAPEAGKGAWTCCAWANRRSSRRNNRAGTIRRAGTIHRAGTIRRAAVIRKAAAGAIRKAVVCAVAAPRCTTPSCWLPTT